MNAIFSLFRIACILAALGLSGCASVSKNECLAGDWYGIGVRDGANGHGEERFVDNAKACVKHGVTPDRERWLDGRMRGLERYCTVRSGLDVGQRGSSYRGVCPIETEGEFLHGYELGRDIAEARGYVSSLNSEISELRDRLERDRKADSEEDRKKYGLSDSERVELAYRLGMAVAKREEAERDVSYLEAKARDL